MALISNHHSMKHGARPQTDELKMLNFNLTDFKAAFNQCMLTILGEITHMTTFSILRHPVRYCETVYYLLFLNCALSSHRPHYLRRRIVASPVFSVYDCGNLKYVFLNLTKIARG